MTASCQTWKNANTGLCWVSLSLTNTLPKLCLCNKLPPPPTSKRIRKEPVRYSPPNSLTRVKSSPANRQKRAQKKKSTAKDKAPKGTSTNQSRQQNSNKASGKGSKGHRKRDIAPSKSSSSSASTSKGASDNPRASSSSQGHSLSSRSSNSSGSNAKPCSVVSVHLDGSESKKTTSPVPKALVLPAGSTPKHYPSSPTPIIYNINNHVHLHGDTPLSLLNVCPPVPSMPFAYGYYPQVSMSPYMPPPSELQHASIRPHSPLPHPSFGTSSPSSNQRFS